MSDNVDTFHLFVNFSFCMVQGGYYLFVLLDDYSGNWSLIFLAIMEVSPYLAIIEVIPHLAIMEVSPHPFLLPLHQLSTCPGLM